MRVLGFTIIRQLGLTLFAMIAAAVFAASDASAASCVAQMPTGLAGEKIASASLDWQCDGSQSELTGHSVVVRLDSDQDSSEEPRYLESPVGKFDSMVLVTTGRDGATLSRRYSPNELYSAQVGSLFAVPLPDGSARQGPVFAVFENLEFPQTAYDARLTSRPAIEQPGAVREVALVSLICGFLLVPALLNVAYYRGMRHRFLAWHSAMAISFALHFASSGPLATVFHLSAFELVLLREVSFAAAIISGMMFLANFIEPEFIGARTGRALRLVSLWVLALCAFKVGLIDLFRDHVMTIYFVGYIPALGLSIFASVRAFMRGSRAAKFQLVGWSPFIVLALLRIFTMAVSLSLYVEGPWVLRLSVAFEIFVTTLGVADRFITIKRQRDVARAEAQALERLADHDPLTGLLNRRAITGRFAQLRSQGFSTMALLDLDRFKAINDRYGHQVGDEVLEATAKAIGRPEDRDSIAVRLGGEEFVVLLRGPDAVNRLDALRQSIPLRIASQVAGLAGPVTASMGVIEIPERGLESMDFEDLYARADKLLYEAKGAGRNRAVYERLILFGEAHSLTSDKTGAAPSSAAA